MPRKLYLSLFVLFVLMLNVGGTRAQAGGPAASAALGTAFTYQGQLKNGGSAVNNTCDFQFGLWDSASGGLQVSATTTQTVSSVTVTNGLFTASIDFGATAFNGNARYLGVAVACPNGGAYTAFASRQPLTAAPFASYALSSGALQGYPVTTTAPGSGQVLKWNGNAWAPDVDAGGVTYSAGVGLTLIGSQFSVVTSTIQQRVSSACGAGFAIRVVNADGTVTCEPVGGWGLTGNAGTNPLTNFLGTSDAQALAFKTNNIERMRVDVNGNVGIGTTSPGVMLTTRSGVNTFPATSGTTQTGGALRMEGGATSVLDFGTNGILTWMQAADKLNLGFNYPILLNPNGGTVAVGTTSPFPQGTFNPSPLQVVANSPKAIVATNRALAITTNDATNPFALDIRLTGAATLANRSVYLQTTDFNLNDGGNILLQPSIGNVGIGTTSSSNKLSVNGTADFSGNVGIGITNPVDAKLVIQIPTSTNGFSITDGNVKLMSKIDPSQAEFGTFSNHDLLLVSGGFGSEMIDAAAGNLFLTCDGCSSLGKSTNRWTAVFAQNGTIQTSDARLKKLVANLNYGLSEVMQLRPITFQWKDGSDARTHLGLLAQDVEQVIPEVVERGSDSAAPLGLSYTGLLPVLIKAVQEQQTMLANNDAKIEALQAENDALNARLTALEQAVNSGSAVSHTESNSRSTPWLLFGGLGVLGLVVVQQRRGGQR